MMMMIADEEIYSTASLFLRTLSRSRWVSFYYGCMN
jgi:hypothetical protein